MAPRRTFELALGRVRIASVAVTFADAAIAPVHEKFGLLVAGDFASAIDGFPLGFMDRGGALSAFGLHGPRAIAGDHMLITTFAHQNSLLLGCAGCNAYQPIC